MDELLENQPLQEIADKAEALYEAVKANYEPQYKGKFLAVEVDNETFYMGDTGKEAIEKARAANPDKVFFLLKIGFSSTNTLASLLIKAS